MPLGGGTTTSSSRGYSVLGTGQVLNPGSGAILGGGSGCPGNVSKVKVGNLWKCPPTAPATSGAVSGRTSGPFNVPTPPSTPAWTPSNLQRPNLTPIDPQAAYDPQIAEQLARQRSYTGDLKAGTGFAMDVLTGQQRDIGNAQLMEAEQAAAQAGVPFNRAQFIMEQQRGLHGAMAGEKLAREQMVGQAIGAESGVAQGQAEERTSRLGLDLRRDVAENELALERYGKDIQKYGVDAQAATAANNALMDFYSRLASGMFSMVGQIGGSFGGGSISSSNVYGSY